MQVERLRSDSIGTNRSGARDSTISDMCFEYMKMNGVIGPFGNIKGQHSVRSPSVSNKQATLAGDPLKPDGAQMKGDEDDISTLNRASPSAAAAAAAAAAADGSGSSNGGQPRPKPNFSLRLSKRNVSVRSTEATL